MARRRSLSSAVRSLAEEYLGVSIQPTEEIEHLQSQLSEAVGDVGTMRRELNRMGYEDFNRPGGEPHELTPKARMTIVRKSIVAWSEDPQAGAAVDLKNAFVFGRGVPKPQCNDDAVQEAVDETWNLPANRRVLTSHAALVQKGTDLQLQSNLYPLFFEDGADGQVVLGFAQHDTIVQGVRHPDDWTRVMWYKAAKPQVRWDWSKGEYVPAGKSIIGYYQALDAFADPLNQDEPDQPDSDGGLGAPAPGDIFPGLLLHVAVNKRSESIFGIPRFKRILRWFNAYEQTMRNSIDLMKAAASIYMKADVRGGRQQLERASYQNVRRASPLTQMAVGMGQGSEMMPTPPPAGPSILYENCFDAETETLTDEGWMGLDELKQRRDTLPQIAAMNDGFLVFEQPTSGLLLYDHDGDIVRISGPRVDAMVTPQHRMLVRDRGETKTKLAGEIRPRDVVPLTTDRGLGGGWYVETFTLPAQVFRGAVALSATTIERHARIRELLPSGMRQVDIAKEVGCNQGTVSNVFREIGRTHRPVDERKTLPPVTLKMDAWLRWLGWYISEGSSSKAVVVSQAVKSQFLASVQEACREMGLPGVEDVNPPSEYGNGPQWSWRARNPKRLRLWLHEYVGTLAPTKRVPSFVFDLAPSQQEIMLKALMEGDGCIRGGTDSWHECTRGTYFTISRGLADDVQRLALNCGYEAAVVPGFAACEIFRVNVYRGSELRGHARRRVGDGCVRTVERLRYVGEVYCFTMPSDTLVTRRHGRVLVSRNSGIQHSPFSIDPHAADSATIAGQARMQIAATTGLPVHLTGDATGVSLASAAAVEPATMAIIHEEQEVWEQVFRTLADRAIARAVATGKLDQMRPLTDEEQQQIQAGLYEGDYDEVSGLVERDLGYTFSLPDPLKRTMADVVGAVTLISKQWDPLNTNRELQRFLFGLVLEQVFDVEDPRSMVDQIFPKRSEEEQTAAEAEAAAIEIARSTVPGAEPEPAPASATAPTSTGVDGRQHPPGNPLGAKQGSPSVQESAVRGARLRPDDPAYLQAQREFEAETAANMRELLAAARNGHDGS